MKNKTVVNILIRRTRKIDFTFFNFPVLTSSIREMYREITPERRND